MTSLDGLKLGLGLSVFEDIISVGNGNSTGLVQGDIIISGTLSQGDGCVASGAFANASGRFSTASDFIVMQQTRTVLLLEFVHPLKVKAQQQFLQPHILKVFKQLLKVLDRMLKDISQRLARTMLTLKDIKLKLQILLRTLRVGILQLVVFILMLRIEIQ